MDLEVDSSGVSMSSLLAEGELVVVLVWPSAVVSTSRAGGGVGIRGRHQLSPAMLLSLKLVLWVVFPCSNATASPATAGGEVSLGSTPSGSSTAGSGGGGKEAWFQAAAVSVDVNDIDSARTSTTAWKRRNSCCTQLRHLDCIICIVTDGYNAWV